MHSPQRDGVERLCDAIAELRRRVGVVFVARGVTLSAGFVLLLSVLPVDLREGRGSPWPLLAASLLLLGLAVGGILYRRTRRTLTPHRLAPEADGAAGLGEGDVLAALELAPIGRMTARDDLAPLAGLHRRRVSQGLASVKPNRLLPASGSRWRRRTGHALLSGGVALAVLGLSAVVRPEATGSAALALGVPWRAAFPPPLPPLRVLLEGGAVARGHPAEVRVQAPERREVTLVWQVTGEPARREVLPVHEGAARGATDPVMDPVKLWAEDAEGEASDTVLVRPGEPLLIEDLRATITYPAYLGRGGEVHRGRVPALVIPEGTRITLAGEANHPLDQARLEFAPLEAERGSLEPAPSLALEVTGRGFSGELWPTISGRWTWSLESSIGLGTPVLPEPLELIVIPDARPEIRLLFPAPDTLLGPDAVMPLVIDIEDDLGLRRAELAWWRSAPSGGAPRRREALSPDPTGRRRAVFRPVLDLRDQDLIPGDTVFYRILAYDGQPGRGPVQSEIFLLRVPTLAAVRAARADESGAIADDVRRLAETAEELERSAADAGRRASLEDPAEGGAPSGEVDFEETEEARRVLEQAEAMRAAMQELEQDLTTLHEDIRESVLSDPILEKQLAELAERYQELLDAGLAERIEELSRALRELRPDAVRDALEKLSGESEWLREQIAQTLRLLDQASLEQAVKAARAEAGEQARAQRDAAQDGDADPSEWAAREERLAGDADSLAESIEELAGRLAGAGQQAAGDAAATAGSRAQEAASAMREAAAAAGLPLDPDTQGDAGPGAAASDAARDAARALEEAASALEGAGDPAATRDAAVESLARARAEALSLAEEEADLAEAARAAEPITPEAWRARQAAVRQGLDNLLSTLSDAGSRSSLLDREIGVAAGEAGERMDRLLERMTTDGGRRLPSRSEAGSVVDGLNELAARLLDGERAAQAAQQQRGQEAAAEQMTSLAQQQQGVTQRTSSLLVPGPKPSGEERYSEVARQQRDIAEQLRELDTPRNDLLGRPAELAGEAEDLARRIESGAAGPETVDRQRTLFRRMLDAGRSLEDEDLDPSRRESETGRAAPRQPPEIDPALLRGTRFPFPSEEVLRELPLHYRRLIFEYFDRLNREVAEPSSAKPGDGALR